MAALLVVPRGSAVGRARGAWRPATHAAWAPRPETRLLAGHCLAWWPGRGAGDWQPKGYWWRGPRDRGGGGATAVAMPASSAYPLDESTTTAMHSAVCGSSLAATCEPGTEVARSRAQPCRRTHYLSARRLERLNCGALPETLGWSGRAYSARPYREPAHSKHDLRAS
jgi:hypothetical protein